jgi:multiple sugar transport system ATP-binding protein
MASVRFENASRTYSGKHTPSVDKLNLEIADGELFVLSGPVGCGKSTSLRMLAGLEEVNGGDIWIGNRKVTDLSPRERDVAMVFQNYALYPHMSVADNLGFALKIGGINKSEIAQRIADAAKILDLEGYLEHQPGALSGGQRHRVAMGRAIVHQPQVLLMDEPLADVDAKLLAQTQKQIASLHKRLGVTTLYVTHEPAEAMAMGERVAVLMGGVLQQCDTPQRIYDHPDNVFVARFIGSPPMNLLDVRVVDGGVLLGSFTQPVTRDDLADAGKEVTLGIRPEDLMITTDEHALPVTVEVVEWVGAEAYLHGSTIPTRGEAQPIIARLESGLPPKKGSVVHLSPKAGRLHLFHPENGQRIGH